jgi:autotransporter-associated beta strand protein
VNSPVGGRSLVLNNVGNTHHDLNLAISGEAELIIDNTGLSCSRVWGTVAPGQGFFSLGGGTLTIMRTSGVPTAGPDGIWGTADDTAGDQFPIEVWPNATDPGAGTIKLVGFNDAGTQRGGNIEFRRGKNGEFAESVTQATNIEISNGRMFRAMVAASDTATLVNTIAANILIKDDGVMNVDGVLSSYMSDTAGEDTGLNVGLVVYPHVRLEAGAGLEIRPQSFGGRRVVPIQVGGINGSGQITLLGSSGILNYAANEAEVILGDVTDEGNGYDFFLIGTTRTHVTNSITANSLSIGLPGGAATGRAVIDPSATLNLTTGIAVQTGSELTMNKAFVGGAVALSDASILVLNNDVFAPAVLVAGTGVRVDLNAQVPWTVNAPAQQIMIGIPGYNATLRLERDDAQIGAINTDGASILSPITGTAATITFAGGDKQLRIGDDTVPILIDLAGGGTNVVINRDLTLAAPNTYTGTTTINTGTTRAGTVTALGAGAVTLATPTGLNPGAVLQLRANNLISGPITVQTGTTLAYYRDASSPVTFAGGTIEAARDVIANGALTDGDVAQFTVASGKTLEFDMPLTMTADRVWTIPSGKVVFASDVTGDILGGYNLTKLGNGMLLLNGGNNDIASLTIGASPGGVVLITGKPPAAVTINQGSAYAVQALNHPYTEVNMAASAGVLALAADNDKPLTFQNPTMSLGALQDSTYSGLLTPYVDLDPLKVPTYNLGGGGSVLTITSALTNGPGNTPRDIQIGWNSSLPSLSNDPIDKGMVLLGGAVSITGYINIWGAAGMLAGTNLDTALEIDVNPGGSFDLTDQPIPGRLLLLGGGVARSGFTLTYDDLQTLVLAGGNYVLGGGGSNNTDVADGALVLNGGGSLIKVGTNQVTLNMPATPGASLNTYDGGLTEVHDGTLVVNDLTSLGQSISINATGGVLKLMGSGTFPGGIALDESASLFVPDGTVIVANNGLTIGGANARPSLTGGGTLDTNGVMVAPLAAGAILDIKEGAKLVTKLGLAVLNPDDPTTFMQPNMFKIREFSTLTFNSAVPVPWPVQNQAVGSMYPGSTLELAAGLGTGGTWYCIAGHPGIRLDVDQAEYDNIGQAAFSSETRTYRFNIGAGTELDFYDVDAAGNTLADGNLMTPVLVGDWGNHRPVAHIEKAGGGEMWLYGMFNPASNDTRLLTWIVTAGTLNVMDDNGMGATASGWLASSKSPAIVQQHMEGVTVKDGATLAWRGQQGFLPASAYGGLPAGEGKGFTPGDFILQDNAILTNSDAPLVLGMQGMGQTYLCYPTIQSSTGDVPNVTVRGNVNLRSGLAVDTTSAYAVPGGLTDMTVSGNVKFSNDLPLAIGTDVIRNLTHTSGTTTIMANQTNLQLLTVQAGSVQLAPTGTIAVGAVASTVNLTASGNLHAASGVTDMSNTMIGTSAPSLMAGLMKGRVDNREKADTPAGRLNTLDDPSSWTLIPNGYMDVAQENTHPPWEQDYQTYVYMGEFYQPTTSVVSFAANIDDGTLLKIDGLVWINDNTWSSPDSASSPQGQPVAPLTAGWHTFEVRFGNGTGGVGPSAQNNNGWTNWTATFGFGYKLDAVTTNAADYHQLLDDGTMNTFRTAPTASVTVEAGATLKARGFQGVSLVDIKGVMAIGMDGSTSTTRQLKLAESAGLATAKLDITNGSLVIDYTGTPNPIADVRRWINQGYNNGDWLGNGITSSSLDMSKGGDPFTYAVGYSDNAVADMPFGHGYGVDGLPLFGNVTPTEVNLTSVLVKYTYIGDINLDGVVDDNDVGLLTLYYNNDPLSPDYANHQWFTGDFWLNDGICDDNDVGMITLTYGLGVGDPLGGSPVGAVPEPATLALLALGGLATLVARRRRK